MPESSYFSGLGPAAAREAFRRTVGSQDFSHGPAQSLLNTLQTGTVSLSDQTGKVSIAPGGAFNLNDNSGFGLTLSPQTSSAGVSFGGANRNLSFEGSWGPDKSVQMRYRAGQLPIPFDTDLSARRAVEAAIPEQKETSPDLSPKEFLAKQIEEYQRKDPNWFRPNF